MGVPARTPMAIWMERAKKRKTRIKEIEIRKKEEKRVYLFLYQNHVIIYLPAERYVIMGPIAG